MKKLIQLTPLLIALLMLSPVSIGAQIDKGKLQPGDIIYTDSGNAIEGGFIIKVDPNTGEQTVISSGGNLIQPFDVKLDDQGHIIVSDTGLCCTLVRIDPDTGQQTVITDNFGGTLGVPFGIALDRSGNILVANSQSILRVDHTTGRIRVVSSGGQFLYPIGVAVGGRNELIVLNMDFPPEILRVNPGNGTQTLIARGGYLNGPQGIAVDGDDIYVTDVATPDRNFGLGRIIHINRQTGRQTVVSEGGFLICPVGIAVDETRQLVVADPYTINPNSPDWFDGGIIRIDPATGTQTLIARGGGSCVNPRGVAIVPGARSAEKRGNGN